MQLLILQWSYSLNKGKLDLGFIRPTDTLKVFRGEEPGELFELFQVNAATLLPGES